MAKKINFDELINFEQTKEYLLLLTQMEKQLKSIIAMAAKTSKESVKLANYDQLQKSVGAIKEATEAAKGLEKVEQEKIRTQKALLQLQQQREKATKKELDEFQKLDAAYKEAAKTAKSLAAQYGVNSEQAKKAAASAKAMKDQIDKISLSVGQGAPMVGRYTEAFEKVGVTFKGMFSAAGLAQLAVQGITKAFGFMKDNIKNIISSVQSVGDAFAANMGGASEATNYLFRSIANLDFSNLLTGLDEAFKAGKKYTEMLDLIGDMQRALGVEKATIESQIAEQEIIAKNRSLDLKQREAAIDKIVELEQEKLKKTKIITSAALQNEIDIAKSRSKLNDDAIKRLFGSIENQKLLAKGQELWIKLMKEAKLAEQSLNDERVISVQLGGDYEESSKKIKTAKEIYLESLSKLTSKERQAVYFAEQAFKIDDTLRGKITTAMEKDIQAQTEYNKGITSTVMLKNRLMKQFLKEENEDFRENEKNSEKRLNKQEEQERLRIEVMQDGIDKEKAIEQNRHENYVKQWGDSELARELHNKKLDEIDAKYRELARKQQEDAAQKIKKKEAKELAELEKALVEIERKNKEHDDRMEKWAKELASKDAKRREDALNAIDDFFDARQAKVERAFEREISASQRQQDYLRELAARGSQDSKNSLAQEEANEAALQLKREKAIRQQKQIEASLAILKAFSKNLESSQSGLEAAIKTGGDLSFITNLLKGLGSFYEGTEDTGEAGTLDSKGGKLAIIHPRERIMTAEQNAVVNGLDNWELANAGMMYKEKVLQIETERFLSAETVLQKFDELKQAIENKPVYMGSEYHKDVHELTEMINQGTSLIRNHKKLSKLG